MHPQHILHITFNMHIGGTEQVIRNLVEGLNPNRFTSSILCIDGEIGPWGEELNAKGFKHYCLSRKPGLDLQLIKNIRALINDHDVDIIHCHQYTPYTYGCMASLFSKKPLIFTEHGRFYPDFSTTKRKLINPLLQSVTSAITAISIATKQALVKFENLNTNKIDVIYNGIADLSNTVDSSQCQTLRNTLNLDAKHIVFGTISRLDPIKNQTMMIKAFADALQQNNNLRLLIVGDGPEREKLVALAHSLRIQNFVIFTGFQSNPQAYLSLMDVFLLPSLSEGTSMTLLEAMSFSKPTIATSVGGTPEIIKDSNTGLLIENDNEQQLLDAILTLSNDSHTREHYGQNARNDYESRFTLSAMSNAYELLYQRITK